MAGKKVIREQNFDFGDNQQQQPQPKSGGSGSYKDHFKKRGVNRAENNRPAPKQQTTAPATAPTTKSGWDEHFPTQEGLRYGMKKNVYVKDIQELILKFPPQLQTGNYLDKTKAAVAQWIAANTKGYPNPDGSVISLELYYDMVRWLKHSEPDASKKSYLVNQPAPAQQPATKPGDKTKPSAPATKDSTTTQNNNAPASSGWSNIKYPLYVEDTRNDVNSEGYKERVNELQQSVGAKMTGVLDEATINAVKSFIEQNKDFMAKYDMSPDYKDKSVLNAKGITLDLLNKINRTFAYKNNPSNINEHIFRSQKLLKTVLRKLL